MNNNQTVEELEARVMTTTGGNNSHQHAKPYYADGLDQNYHRKYLVRSAGRVRPGGVVARLHLRSRGRRVLVHHAAIAPGFNSQHRAP